MASVAMVVTNACSPDPRVQRSAVLLAKKGHEVTIHAFDRTQASTMSEVVDGVRIMRYQIGAYPYGATLATLWGLRAFSKMVKLTLLAKPPDCIYCHDADTLAIGVDLAARTESRLVYDMHDLQHTWALMGRPKSILRRFVAQRMERKALQRARKAHLVITSSGSLKGGRSLGFKDYLKQNQIESIVVENRPKAMDRKQKNPEQKGDWTVAFLGRVREIEAFQLLTRAIETMPESDRPNLKIAGDGTAVGPVHEHLLSEAPRLGIHLNLSLGFEAAALPALMADVDVMYAMYPPERGNIMHGALPVKMFDAASFGIPTVVNSSCLMGEICEKEALGSAVKWGDENALAQALLFQRDRCIALANTGEAQQEAYVQAIEALF
ncbi:MAG: glycosyltransferase [Candidatus Poseidoniaceae archaeon]|nr:glycosyltransferase [Candidatus Poseidoniaceae archaeon]